VEKEANVLAALEISLGEFFAHAGGPVRLAAAISFEKVNAPAKLRLEFFANSGMMLFMRKTLSILFAALVCGGMAFAQMGGGPSAGFDNGMEKLFSDNPVFTATMQTRMALPNGPMTVTAKMYFDHSSSRTEMSMTDVHGGNVPPAAVAQMQSLGMDKIVMITTADKKSVYMIYPRIHSYAAIAVPSPTSANDYNVQTTKLGRETANGHSCVKNKIVLTNNGQSNELTVWNATDLNNFPVEIVQNVQGMSATIWFENVSFDKLDRSLFQPPSNYTRYSSMQELMAAQVASHSPGGAATGSP
jgi:hypothetical protein